MKQTKTFLEVFVEAVSNSILNNYLDNYDYLRFGESPLPNAADRSWKESLRNQLNQRGWVHAQGLKDLCVAPFKQIAPFAERLQWLYSKLADDESRRLLTEVLAFRSLGHTRVKLSLNTPEYWQGIRSLEQYVRMDDYIQLDFKSWRLLRMGLHSLGFPIELYNTVQGAFTQFGLQQYRCCYSDRFIQAEPGDYVIDGGACFGDTALYFAHKVGAEGKVFGYEFIPSNLSTFYRNLKLNPRLADRISLIERALWDTSDLPLHYVENGSGSSVSFSELPQQSGTTTTLSIDDLVQRNQLPRIDFIKMDIEGAELWALHGATETLKRYRPKLAIAIYHKLDDFVEIPEFLDSLSIGYRFYIRHFTVHAEETVLFAVSGDADLIRALRFSQLSRMASPVP